jgi:hypothetical protein
VLLPAKRYSIRFKTLILHVSCKYNVGGHRNLAATALV